MVIRKEIMTPERAKELLKTNENNRNLHANKIEKLMYDIRNGEWHLTHQPIAIDKFGKLIDGQHRLSAIVATGIDCEMMIAYNAEPSEKIDVGASRKDKEALMMAGIIQKGTPEYSPVTYPIISFIYQRNFGENAVTKLTATVKHKLYLKYQEYIDPLVKIANCNKNGRSRSAPILYAMMCAEIAGVPIEKLKDWHLIVSTGDFYVEGDEKMLKAGRCVLLFKNFVESGHFKSREEKETLMKKAMSSIRHYVKGNSIKGLLGELCYQEVILDEEL